MVEPSEDEDVDVQANQTNYGHWDKDTVRKVLAAKDEGNISDKAYHRLRMALPEENRKSLPSIHIIKAERAAQNGSIDISDLPQVKY